MVEDLTAEVVGFFMMMGPVALSSGYGLKGWEKLISFGTRGQAIKDKPSRGPVSVRGFFGGGGAPKANAKGKGCRKCQGKGAVECQGCKGSGKNKKNGNMFERWKCYDCQGFGMVGCPNCGSGGLTPEQRGER